MDLKRRDLYLKLNLKFFASDEKTEKPTPRKKTKARGEGQVAKSQEIGTAFLFIAMFLGLRIFAAGIFEDMQGLYIESFELISDLDNVFNVVFISKYLAHIFGQVILIILPILVISAVIGLVTNLIQVGWHPTTKPLKPKFNKLNPISGFKRLFSMKILVDLVKALLKAFIIAAAIYMMVNDEVENIPTLAILSLMDTTVYLADLAATLGINIGILFIFIAIADYGYARYSHTKELKMTKQEVKDEYKNIEGDPQIKGKIRQKMREASMRRMMNDVPSADVIITNPTHYAVAIKYDKNISDAPRVTAKGVDFVARRIKEKAIENDIEIVEDRQLARTLYATVDVGRDIPEELYQAVAEILAFVYKLKNKV